MSISALTRWGGCGFFIQDSKLDFATSDFFAESKVRKIARFA
jgi:hypothetical protein